MRVLIIGIDGYLGWSLAQYLTARGHEVGGIDAYFRREQVKEIGSHSAIPIAKPKERIQAFKDKYNKELYWVEGNVTDWDITQKSFEIFEPDAIVHLGENPSAPYSMIDQAHAAWVQKNNVIATQFHPEKSGTLGLKLYENFLKYMVDRN